MTVLHFDAGAHRYSVGGTCVPSVTQVLSSVLDELRFIDPVVLAVARARGQAVHRATELLDRGTLDDASIAEGVRPYLNGYARFLREVRPRILSIEERVYSATYGYAGTFDRIAAIGGHVGILDIKTGPAMRSHGPQTAAYLEAFNASMRGRGERAASERYTLRLSADGTYSLHVQRAARDLSTFLAALTIYKFNHPQ